MANKKINPTDNTTTVTFRVPETLWRECKAHSASRGEKLSEWIRFALEQQLARDSQRKAAGEADDQTKA